MVFPVLLAATALAQAIAPNGVTNAASYASGFIAPGEIIAIFGEKLGPEKLTTFELDRSGKIATSLAGVTVMIDGRLAPLIYVSAGQIAAIAPYGLSSTMPRVMVSYKGNVSPSVSLILADAQPGFFSLDSSGTGQAAAINQDGSLNGAANPASKGSVISLYGTGEGSTNPGGIDGQIATVRNPRPVLPVSASVGGFAATVLYAAAAPTQVAGMFQVNLRIPTEVVPGPAVPVVVNVGSKSSSKKITIAVQ